MSIKDKKWGIFKYEFTFLLSKRKRESDSSLAIEIAQKVLENFLFYFFLK